MYGWMTRHLKGIGDGSPTPEPKLNRKIGSCEGLAEEFRPRTHISLPQYARQLAGEAMKKQVEPVHPEHWESEANGGWRT
ncbi:MAG: hypothetical protein Ct9H300mP1_25680 [Planctomycetaceae bacterium]|nr:MAG: hypothetical protein Ct9H300mP1_25680 [Planctomycetaceae bacterium]